MVDPALLDASVDMGPEVELGFGLEAHQASVSDAATEVLNGLSLRGERDAFIEALRGYSDALQASGEETVEGILEDGGDITDVKTGLIGSLIQSKSDIITDASFQHEQESRIEDLRDTLSSSRLGRFATKLAIGAATGVASYAAIKGVDLSIPSEATGVAGFFVGMKVPLAAKMISKSITGKANAVGINSVVRHDAAATREIMTEVASIEDPVERDRAKHALLTEKFHIGDTKSKLWEILGPMKLEGQDGVTTKEMVEHAVDVTTESIAGFFGVEQEEVKEKAREIARDTAIMVGAEVVSKATGGLVSPAVAGGALALKNRK